MLLTRSSTRGVEPPSRETELADRIERETERVSRSGVWTAPVGTIAFAIAFAIFANAYISGSTLILWLLATVLSIIATTSGAHIGAPTLMPPDTVARLRSFSHLTVGFLMGATLWLDLEATRDSTFRWTTAALLFAFSTTAVSAPSSLSRIALGALCIVWTVAGLAMIAIGHPLAAAAGFAFVVVIMIEMTRSRRIVHELITRGVESQQEAEESAWAATHDSLTRLPNRQGLLDALAARTNDPESQLIALFIDLDHFKQVNDRLGHHAGDAVLMGSAERLLDCFRPEDIVGRLGGDEFLVLLASGANPDMAGRLAERTIASLEAPFVVADSDGMPEEAFISASIGIAGYPDDASSPQELIDNADQALYVAKRHGRRRAIRFDHMNVTVEPTSDIEAALRSALHHGEIEADAQPIFSLATGEVVWVELFARFYQPDGSPVSPAVFVPLADEIGLAGDLMARMFDIAGDVVPTWAEHPRLANAKISINASPIEFGRKTMVSRVTELISRNNLECDQVILEIGEAAVINEDTAAAQQLAALAALGVGVAVHDFGIGYTSPQRLLELPVQAIKLNRGLLASLGGESRHQTMLKGVHTLASAIAPTVVAEGVETSDQLDLMAELGVTAAQGYHLCHPMPIDTLATHLATSGGPDTGI